YRFAQPAKLARARLVFDSDLERESCAGHPIMRRYPMLCNRSFGMEPFGFPKTMVRAFLIECETAPGKWVEAARVSDNHQRLCRIPLDMAASAIRFTPLETWGSAGAHLFAFDADSAVSAV
ncbi:MAG: hypothetical protein LBJ10_02255, partial [Clostridiales bacterium]|nr:hypothetical protein [Clostridiales bacterium]